MPKDQLTYDDISLIKYGWETKSDPKGSVDWNELEPLLEKQYPELLAAIKAYELAERTVGWVLDGIDTNFPEEDDAG